MRKAITIPLAIALLIPLAFATSTAYRVPTAEVVYLEGDARPETVATVEFEVAGLKCRGMAGTFSEQIKVVPGVVSFIAYARTHTAIIEYDPTLTDPDAIREAFEAPMVVEGTTYNDVFEMVSQKAR